MANHYIFALWLLLSSFFLFLCSLSIIGRRKIRHLGTITQNLSGYIFTTKAHIAHTSTWCGLTANLECRSKCAAGGSLEMQDPKYRQKFAIWAPSRKICRVISSQLRHISSIGKKLLSSNIFSKCTYNMVNFGPLVAENGPVVG